MQLKTPIDALGAGPIHFSYSGWAFVSILEESALSPDVNCYLTYDHPFSFEADSWINQDGKVCFLFVVFPSVFFLVT